MPRSSVWLIRASLGYFVVGITIGSLLLIQKATALGVSLWSLRALHVEALLFGFMIHLAFGVALWILPRPTTPPSDATTWVAAALLNAGVWMAGFGGGFLRVGTFELLGRISEAGAMVVFICLIWPRVRAIRPRHAVDASP